MRSNILKKTFGSITNNLGIKLLAVIVSCCLWLVVNIITDPVDNKTFNNIPIELVNEEAGMVYKVNDGTNSVNVKVTGRISVVNDLTREEIKAVADISKLTSMDEVVIDISCTRPNAELEFKKNIDSIKLTIEKRDDTQKNITASTSGKPADGYIVERADASPNVVRFSGPASLIRKINRVDAVATIDGSSSNITTSVELRVYDADGKEIKDSALKMNVDKVNVSVSILATKEIPLKFVVQDAPPAGYTVSGPASSEPATVLIAGRSNVLAGISELEIKDPGLSVKDMTEDMASIVDIKNYLPNGVQLAGDEFDGNVNVTVEIEKFVTKDLTVPARCFAADNKPKGFNVTLKETADAGFYKIRIEGTKEAVDAVTAENIIGVVDMNAIKEKDAITEWTAGTYFGEITFNLSGNVKLAERYMMTLVVENIDDIN